MKSYFLLNANAASYYLYVVIFAGSAFFTAYGARQLYTAAKLKDEHLQRRARFILLFALITLLCTAVVSFLLTGVFPLN